MAIAVGVTVERDRYGNIRLVPATADDAERLGKETVEGYVYDAVLSGSERSRLEERWYRAFVRYVATGLEVHPDSLHSVLKWRAGKVLRILPGAVPVAELKSSRDMQWAEFHDYVRTAVDIVFRDFLPAIRRDDVLRHVERMTGIERPFQ
jgi:hypothetical protein